MKYSKLGLMGILAAALALCGCSSSIEETTAVVSKDGKVTSYLFEQFSQSYYDKDELEQYIEEEIEKYVSDNPEASIKLSKLKLSDDTLRAQIEFGTDDDYAGFNSVTFYNASVVQAMSDGYEFDVDFYDITDSVETEADNSSDSSDDAYVPATVSLDDITADTQNKVIITDENIDIRVKGKILYVSEPKAKLLSKDTVSLPKLEEGDEKEMIYIIYN